jgi:NADH dehydrogenase FAD-containing subunit
MRVVIVGGGFGGLAAARALGRERKIELTLVDRRNHHLFQPLLYQVAMAGLSPAEISAPIRSLLASQPNTRVRHERVHAVKPGLRAIETDTGEIGYDRLIVAAAARHTYFGHDEWEEHAPGLESLGEATGIRRRVLSAYERAEMEPDAAAQEALLTFVVVGGGPTGVELEIFAIGDLARLDGPDGRPLPGLAPVAIQQGRHAAHAILRDLRGGAREAFRYRDRGQMATIGRSRALCDLGRVRFAGFAAWVMWLVVHIYFLVSSRNRLFVVLQWAWSYLTFRRGARLIVAQDWRSAGEEG